VPLTPGVDERWCPWQFSTTAPIRGPPQGAMQQRDDLDTRRSRHLDPPVDVMPDYENQNQDLVW